MESKPKTPDDALLPRLRAGDAQAFEEMVRTYHGSLQRVASAIVGVSQSEEVVQDAWMAAIQNLARFEGRSTLKTWLTTIVRNEAINRLRKKGTEVSMSEQLVDHLFSKGRFADDGHWAEPPTEWHDDSPEALLSQEEFLRCIEKTLAHLPDHQRAALILRDQEEMPLEEICNILSVTASNIRVLIHRARMRLYTMVEHFEETGKC